MAQTALVLGAGMVGVSVALALRSRGLAVTLLDRLEPGRETSYGNAGVLSRGSIQPFNTPSLFKKLPHYLSNRHPALRYDLGHLVRNPGWPLGFLMEARRSRLAPRRDALNALLDISVTAHRRLVQEAGVGHRLRETGWIKVWRSETGGAEAQADQALFQAYGIESEVLDRQALSGLEPDLTPIFPAALWIKSAASVDNPGAVVQAYADLFARQGGAIRKAEVSGLQRQTSGWRIQTSDGELAADIVVVALGPWSADLLRLLGIRVPLGVERGYHGHYATNGKARLTRPINDIERAYILTPMEQGYRITSGVELKPRDAPSSPDQLAAALISAREAFPLGAALDKEPWRGARPTMPDSLPMIGEIPRQPGLYAAFGHQHIGFTMGPGTGALIADLVTGARPVIDPLPYAPARYIA